MRKLFVVMGLLAGSTAAFAQQPQVPPQSPPQPSAVEQALSAELGEQISKNVQWRTRAAVLEKQLEEQKAKVADLTKQLDEAKKSTVAEKRK